MLLRELGNLLYPKIQLASPSIKNTVLAIYLGDYHGDICNSPTIASNVFLDNILT